MGGGQLRKKVGRRFFRSTELEVVLAEDVAVGVQPDLIGPAAALAVWIGIVDSLGRLGCVLAYGNCLSAHSEHVLPATRVPGHRPLVCPGLSGHWLKADNVHRKECS